MHKGTLAGDEQTAAFAAISGPENHRMPWPGPAPLIPAYHASQKHITFNECHLTMMILGYQREHAYTTPNE